MGTDENTELAKAAERLWGTYTVPTLAGVQGSVEFVGAAVRCYMQIDDGKVTLGPGDGPADTVVASSVPEELLRLAQGKCNMVTSLLKGRVEVSGDLLLLTKIAGSMPELGKRAAEQLAAGGT